MKTGSRIPQTFPRCSTPPSVDQVAVVYGEPVNRPPHGALRNGASRTAKWLIGRVGGATEVTKYNSFRLVLGEVGRSVAAYAGSGIYLDIALGWVAKPVATSPVTLRDEGDTGLRLPPANAVLALLADGADQWDPSAASGECAGRSTCRVRVSLSPSPSSSPSWLVPTSSRAGRPSSRSC